MQHKTVSLILLQASMFVWYNHLSDAIIVSDTPAHVLMQMCDTPTEEGLSSLQKHLASIVSQTSADASHAAYHAQHLQLLLRNLEQQPVRSVNSH